LRTRPGAEKEFRIRIQGIQNLIFMDKTGIIVVTLCAILLGSGLSRAKAGAHCRNSTRRTHNVPPPAQAQHAADRFTTAPPATTGPIFRHERAGKTIVLTNAHARYTFTSRGGGLKRLSLLDYPETISARWKKEERPHQRRRGHAERARVRAGAGDFGRSSLIGDGNFTLTKTDDGVRAEKFCRTVCG
jgi:hypothetical protein